MAPTLNAFRKLDDETRKAIIDRCIQRKHRFLALTRNGVMPAGAQVLLVGDMPAPSAPDDPDFHYTPFGALWNSSLFVNLALQEAGIPEDRLAWVNAANFLKSPTPYTVLDHPWPLVVALGGNAEKWFMKSGRAFRFERFDHPAYHKRFHGKAEYPLGKFLKEYLNV